MDLHWFCSSGSGSSGTKMMLQWLWNYELGTVLAKSCDAFAVGLHPYVVIWRPLIEVWQLRKALFYPLNLERLLVTCNLPIFCVLKMSGFRPESTLHTGSGSAWDPIGSETRFSQLIAVSVFVQDIFQFLASTDTVESEGRQMFE